MVSRRRAVVASAVVFLSIGLLRGTIMMVLDPMRPAATAIRTAALVTVSLFWVPVTLLVVWSLRWRLGRRSTIVVRAFTGLAAVALEPYWTLWIFHLVGRTSDTYIRVLVGRFDTNALFYASVVGTVVAAAAWSRYAEARRTTATLEGALTDAQLHVLTLQLHPHFLYNTLNLISQLAYESAAEAKRTIQNLRALLVESLAHAALREVRLDEELRFLGAYVEIQQTRFRSRLTVDIEVDPAVAGAAVPHLLLQPLVENAIAHGIARRAAGGSVRISAQRAGDRLVIRIADDGQGITRPIHERMGLTNTRLRLTQLFGRDYRLTLAPGASAGTIVTVDIPFRSIVPSHASAGQLEDAGERLAAVTDAATESAWPAMPPAWVQIVACWAALAMLWTELDTATQLGLRTGATWAVSAGSSISNAIVWLALTPLVLLVARRVDVTAGISVKKIAAHLATALGVAVVHLGIWYSVLAAFMPLQFRLQFRSRFGWALWDVVAYGTIVAFAAVVTSGSRYRAAKVVIAETRARLSQARLASLRLRLQPAVFLAGLDAIAERVTHDPVRAEEAIARMGDLLRHLLASATVEWATLDDELETLHAFVDVVSTNAHASHRHPLTIETTSVPAMRIPAMIAAPVAAALGGVVRLVKVDADASSVRIQIAAASAEVNVAHVAELRARLRALYGDDGCLTIDRAEDHSTTAELRLPRDPGAGVVTDDAFEPVLGIA